jgi:hypothetical protein
MLLLVLLFQGLYQTIEAFGIAGDRPRGLLLPSNVFASPLPPSRFFSLPASLLRPPCASCCELTATSNQRLGLFSKVGKRAEDLLRDIPSFSTVETETPTVTLDDGSLL